MAVQRRELVEIAKNNSKIVREEERKKREQEAYIDAEGCDNGNPLRGIGYIGQEMALRSTETIRRQYDAKMKQEREQGRLFENR